MLCDLLGPVRTAAQQGDRASGGGGGSRLDRGVWVVGELQRIAPAVGPTSIRGQVSRPDGARPHPDARLPPFVDPHRDGHGACHRRPQRALPGGVLVQCRPADSCGAQTCGRRDVPADHGRAPDWRRETGAGRLRTRRRRADRLPLGDRHLSPLAGLQGHDRRRIQPPPASEHQAGDRDRSLHSRHARAPRELPDPRGVLRVQAQSAPSGSRTR